MGRNTAAVPRKVDFRKYNEDLQVAMLAAIGFYDRTIAEITGLSLSQVRYRIRKSSFGTDRKLYREGRSKAATFMAKNVGGSGSYVRQSVINELKDNDLY